MRHFLTYNPGTVKERARSADQKGATLLEFLIYIAIVGTVLTAAVLFSLEFVNTQAKSQAVMESTRNARFAVDRIAAEVRAADSINTGSSTFGTASSVLSLATSVGGTNPTVFSLSGTTLMMQQGVSAAVALTSSKVDVTEFQVDDVSNGNKTKSVRIHVKTVYKNTANLTQFSANATIETTAKVNKGDGFAP